MAHKTKIPVSHSLIEMFVSSSARWFIGCFVRSLVRYSVVWLVHYLVLGFVLSFVYIVCRMFARRFVGCSLTRLGCVDFFLFSAHASLSYTSLILDFQFFVTIIPFLRV